MRRNQQGFTLVEVLVALAIIAAMAGVTFEAIAQNAHTRRQVTMRRDAVLVAQSALDRAVGGDSAESGRSGALGWRIERRPYGPRDPLDRHPLEEVVVRVDDDAGKALITVSTVRIAG